MKIKYLKKASKTASTDDTKTKDIVQNLLKEKYGRKRLNANQKKLAENLSEAIIIGSETISWNDVAKKVVKQPETLDKLGIMKNVQDLSAEHDLNTYAAALLYHSNKK